MEQPEEEGPRYLFDIDNLVLEQQQLVEKEATDRATANSVEFPDTEMLREKLREWATKGFPDGYPVFSFTIDPPQVCVDGVHRTLFEYIEYLTGVPISEKIIRLSSKLKSMHIECSYCGNTVTFHVFRD